MRALALALLGSSALFAFTSAAQTGSSQANTAATNQNQASLADCDHLVTVFDQRKSGDTKMTPASARNWIRENNAQACHDTLARLNPKAATQSTQGVPNADGAQITVQDRAQAPLTATPIEITADIVNARVICRPQRARLPALTVLDLRVQNRSTRIIRFVAPKFFDRSDHLESSGLVYDLTTGGFAAAPNSTVRVLLRSPPAGDYYFSCNLPMEAPTPISSGFLIVERVSLNASPATR